MDGACSLKITNIACGPGHGIGYGNSYLSPKGAKLKLHQFLRYVSSTVNLIATENELMSSIRSLGANNSEDHVSYVKVDTAQLKGRTNGLRIKTWQVIKCSHFDKLAMQTT